MATIDETQQGVHPFTLGWWRELPECYRRADRVQGYRLAPAWHGLNRDPRLVTGWDKWHRTNTSTRAWGASVAFTRTFRSAPHVPLHVKSWHTAQGEGNDSFTGGMLLGEGVLGSGTLGDEGTPPMTVRHVIRNHTGQIVVDEARDMYGPDREVLDTPVTPDRFGVVQVTVEVAVAVPDGRDLLDGIHVGRQDPAFDELPTLDDFLSASAYPLLRYMDGIGHQAGYLSDMVNDMHDGDYTDPVTAPESSLPMLAALLGVSGRYAASLSRAELREHLVSIVEGSRPAAGSRDLLAITARQWLTGSRQVSVVPAHAQPGHLTPTEQALADAIGWPDRLNRLLVANTAPAPRANYRWTATANASVSRLLRYGTIVAENRMTNPRFAETTNGWYTNASASVAHDTTVYEIGGSSAKISPTGAGWYFLTSYRTPAETGTNVLRFRVYSEQARTLVPAVWKYDGGEYEGGEAHEVPAGQWTTLSMDFTTTEGQRYRPSIRSLSDDPLTPLWVDWAYEARTRYDHGAYFDGGFPDSSRDDVWIDADSTGPVTHTWDGEGWTAYTATDVTAEAQAVVDERNNGDRTRVHTLLVIARADEVPDGDLAAFADFLNGSGVVPAGHKVEAREATQSWDSWEAAVGTTWGDYENRVQTWNDNDSIGVTDTGGTA